MDIVNDRTVWSSDDLSDDSSWRYTLDENDIEDLEEGLKAINSSNINIEDISKDNFPLKSFSEKLVEIQDYIEHDRGIFTLKGIPVGKYSRIDLQRIFIGMNSHLGTPVIQSTEGELIHEVMDKGENLYGDKGRGTNTKERLPWHTDRSDVVTLLCIRPAANGGESMIASLTKLYNSIKQERPDLAEVLCNPYFHARAPFECTGLSRWYKLPVFTVCKGRFAGRYLRHFITISQDVPEAPRLSAIQIEALDYMDKRLHEPDHCTKLLFEVGDMQILNNFTTVHSREQYTDDEDKKRYLLRAWLSMPNSRELMEDFSELYGDTAAGALRGGILPPATEQTIN